MRNIRLWVLIGLLGFVFLISWLISGNNIKKILITKNNIKQAVIPTSITAIFMPSPTSTVKLLSSYALTETYSNKDLGIVVHYPKGWLIQEDKKMNGKVTGVRINGAEGDIDYIVNPDGGGFDPNDPKLQKIILNISGTKRDFYYLANDGIGDKQWFGEYYDRNNNRIVIGAHIHLTYVERKPELEKMVLDMLGEMQGLPQ